MGRSVCDVVMDHLQAWGVQRVYTHACRATGATVSAASRATGVGLVTVAGAEAAALSAYAHAKFTGRPGVCVTSWGRDTVRAFEALQDASLEGRPVVVIAVAGSPPRLGRQKDCFRSLCAGVAAAGVQKVGHAAEFLEAVAGALRAAVQRGGVACVVVPRSVQEGQIEAETSHVPGPASGPLGVVVIGGGGRGGPDELALLARVRAALPEEAMVACDWEEAGPSSAIEATTPDEAAMLCPGVPYALAAKFAYPDRPVVAVTGSRAMQMLGNNGLVAVCRHWRDWSDPRLAVVVLEDWASRRRLQPGSTVGAAEGSFSFTSYARILDLGSERVETSCSLSAALQRAMRSRKPAVIEVTAAAARANLGAMIEAAPAAEAAALTRAGAVGLTRPLAEVGGVGGRS